MIILKGDDYGSRDELMSRLDRISEENRGTGEPVISTGIEIYDKAEHKSLLHVFEKADRKMYERKQLLKQSQA